MSGKGLRVLTVFKALEAHPLIGIGNKEIADSLGLTPTQVSRDLADLVEAELVQKLDNGNYCYSTKTLQIAIGFQRQHDRIKAKVAEIENRMKDW